MYKCIAVFTIVAFQLLGRGACASNLREAPAEEFYRIMAHVDSLSVAKLAELCVDASCDVANERYSQFECCCSLNRMASLVSAHGLLNVLDNVRHDCPERGAKIINRILNFVEDGWTVFNLRYESPPVRSWGALRCEFLDILNMPLVDGSRKLDERMVAVCHDVEGLLLNECSGRLADALLYGDMALCHDDGARHCAEEFYEKSRRAHRRRAPGRVFLAGHLGDVAAQIEAAHSWRYRPHRDNPAVFESVRSFGKRYRNPGDLLTMRGVPPDVRDDVRLIVEHSIRERLCWAVFPGTKSAYNRSIGDVLNSVWLGDPHHHIRLDGPTFLRLRSYDDGGAPLHRFWCWTNEVLAVADLDDLIPLLDEAIGYCADFDQIAFKQGAYGDYRLVLTWLVMREYVYSRRGDRAQAPPCCFSPKTGESVFRLLRNNVLSVRNIRQLLAICRYLGGWAWDAMQRDSDFLLQPTGPECDNSVALILAEVQGMERDAVRLEGGGIY
jgi:hypothetical protein